VFGLSAPAAARGIVTFWNQLFDLADKFCRSATHEPPLFMSNLAPLAYQA
jgi:hypothetical protein